MSTELAERIRQTQSSFPEQQPGPVAACPFKETAPDEQPLLPVAAKTAFHLTQEAAKTMGPVAGEKPKEKKAWIEIILVDMEGKPVPGVRYKITPPGGGAPQEGRLNAHGQAGYYKIEPGECKITFPDLDKDSWQ